MQQLTEADRWLVAEVTPMLEAGESLVAGAYLQGEIKTRGGGLLGAATAFASAARARGYHAVLTDRRLILIEARVGAFKPLLENKGVASVPLASIDGLQLRKPLLGNKLKVALWINGAATQLIGHDKHVSSTSAFFERLGQVAADNAAARSQ